MNQETLQLIEKIADKLGTSADHLCQVMARQAISNSISYCVHSAIIIITILLTVKPMIKHTKKGGMFYDDKGTAEAFRGIWIFIAVALCCYIMAIIPKTISGFINPEYQIIRELFEKN